MVTPTFDIRTQTKQPPDSIPKEENNKTHGSLPQKTPSTEHKPITNRPCTSSTANDQLQDSTKSFAAKVMALLMGIVIVGVISGAVFGLIGCIVLSVVILLGIFGLCLYSKFG